MTSQRLTIAICTMDRHGPLADVIRSLAEQDLRQGWDVLVLDEGRVPVDAAALRALLPDDIDVRCLRKDAADRPGLYGSRRACVRHPGGEIVLFLDDDARPAPGYVRRLMALAAAHPDHAGFGGVDVVGLPATASRLALAYARAFLVAGPGPGRLGRTGFNHAQMSWRMQPGPFESEFLHGCNMAFRRAALSDLPDLAWIEGHSCCEDLVLSLHAARKGPLMVDPGLAVRHEAAPGGRGSNGQRLFSTIANHARFQAWRRPGSSRAAFLWSLAGLLAKDLTRGLGKRGLAPSAVLGAYACAGRLAMRALRPGDQSSASSSSSSPSPAEAPRLPRST